jgi:putative nucleotidyltransferase with HDIG domain
MASGRAAMEGTQRSWLRHASALQVLFPERLLDGTPYRELWREAEARAVVLGARASLVAAAVGLVLHHFFVDLPLHKAPAARWLAFRFGGAAVLLALVLLYFVPRLRRLPWARLPILAAGVALSTVEARAVDWSPATVSYLYAFLLAAAGVLLARQALVTAVGTLWAVLGVQWVFAWRSCPRVTGAELVSATVFATGLVLMFRVRMGTDVRAFLTEKRELDAQKKLIETQIELDRVKTNFFTNVSHELRTPLALVIAPLEAALSGPRPLAPELREDLELALRNAQRLLGEISTLLDLSRLDARHEKLHLEPVDVVATLRELVESGRRLAESKHLALSFEPEVPILIVPVDAQKLEKVILNLLSNALRFTDGQEERPGLVIVRCGRRADRLWCSVEDTGIGIPEAQLSRIFDRFHQVEHGRERRGGTGIGLSLVKELVDLHMGTIAVTSRAGQGSTFTVELPVDPAVYPIERLAPREEALREERPILTPAPTASSARELPVVEGVAFRPLVLLVDDNRELLEYVSRQLSTELRIRTAGDVEEALAAVAQELPDLVVSDVMMPGRSGVDLLRELRARHGTRPVPVVLLTARSDPEFRIEALEGGADDYLAKPFSAGELRARIRSLLSRGKIERELVDRNAYLSKVNLDLVLSKRKVLIETMEAFALAVEAKDPYTHGHSRRVSLLAERVCRELGLGGTACETVRIAGILHDIGKIGMPELVLKKPGRLTAPEVEVFKRHAQLGSRIVSAVTELEEVGRAILHHHERFDGKGYPDRLAGDQIPLLSRILTVADSYDAMTSDRPYRTSVSHRQAMEEVARCRGTQFDPMVADTFLQLYAEAAPDFSGLGSGPNPEALRSAGA